MSAPDCWSCTGFFVTHEAHLPYGCRPFGMKTRVLPMIEVARTSGAPCQAFVRRPDPPGRARAESKDEGARTRP